MLQVEAVVISLLLAKAAVAAGFSKIPASTAVSVPRRSSLDESKMSAATPDLTPKVNTVDRRVAAALE